MTFTTKQGRAADGTSFTLLFVGTDATSSGSVGPVHGMVDANGNLITPAKDTSLQSILAALGASPAQDASVQEAVTALGTPADASATTDAGTFSLIALIKRGLTNWTTLLGRIPALVSGRLPVTAPSVDSTGSLANTNDAVTVSCGGMNTGIIRMPTGSWSGTLVAEGSVDGTFSSAGDIVALSVLGFGPGAISQSSITAAGAYEVTITGMGAFRVRATSSITSGPVSALVRAPTGNKSIRVGAPSGNPVPVNPGVGSALEASSVVQSLSGLNLLSTQASSSRIGLWYFQNQSAATLTVVLDDGAGNNVSAFNIDPGAGSGRQGGDLGHYNVGPHTGRIRVYGTAGGQHALRVQ